MRKYKLTVELVDEENDTWFHYKEFIIEQEESSYPTTKWLAYRQAKDIVDSMENVQKYTLERVL